MNKPRFTRYVLASALTLALSSARIVAQTTNTAASDATVPANQDEEVVVLSPFVVESTEDEGKYRASATLAGSRLRTDLRDIASPLSVVTSQFLQDTAATSNQDLLTYTTSTEVGGLFGNWGGFGNAQGVSDRNTLLSPNQNTRVRGLDQADNTRNFMLTDIPWDSYNTERVEIQRGPNSILFGVGSPAGIINANTIQARFDGNSGKFENQIGKYASVRWVADYNVEVVDDLLAIRVAGLFNDQKFRQEPAFNDDRRGYITATFQPQVLPQSWAGKLTVRANYEKAKITANRPRILPPEDGISLWFEDYAGDGVNNKIGFSKQVYDMFLWSQTGGGDASRGTLATAAATVLNPLPYQPAVSVLDGGALNNGGIGFWFRNGDSRPFFVSRQAPRENPGALNASGGVDNAIDIPYGSPMRVGGLNAYALSIDKIDEVEHQASRYPLATRGYYKDQSLTDPTIFNFYDHLIDGDNKREHQEWDATNISVAQTFLDNRLGLEFVYDSQSYSEWRSGATWSRPYISIDINKNLQNQLTQYTRVNAAGQPDPAAGLIDTSSYQAYGFTPSAAQPYVNPMAGAAFTAGSFSNNNRTDRERENYRLTTFAEFRAEDFFNRNSLLTRILGRHIVTGLLSREERREEQTQWAPSATPYDWALGLSVAGADTNLTGATRGITPVIYLSEPLFDRTTAHGLNLGAIQTYYNPSGTYQVDYFKTEWLPSRNPADASYVDPGAQWINLLGGVGVQADNPFNYRGRTNAPVDILNADTGDYAELVTNFGVAEQIVDSAGLVWQGHLLGGNIVPTVGWRKDKLRTYTATGAKDATGISATEVGKTEQVLDNEGRTTSWGVVAHVPKSWMQNVPVLSGLSAYYNYGENNRVEARYNYDGEPLDNPSAESKDYGIVLSAFEDKLSIKVGKYETKVKNANLPGGSSILGSNQYYLYQLEAWGTANTLLYAFGRAGLDPNQSWHWNWAGIDATGDGGNPAYAPTTDLFLNHPSSQRQLAAMDAWMDGLDAQFFTNYAINANVQALKTAYTTWRSSGNIQPLVDAAKASGFNVGTYTTGFSSQNNGQINGISPNGTIDNTSKGYEIEVNWTPTPSWNIQVNAAKTDAFRESLGKPMLDYIDKQWSRLQGPAGDIRLWWGGDNPVRRYYSDNIVSAVEFQKESIGFQVPEMRPWRFGAITNYSFKEGTLKGFNVGGAYRWEDKQILGYGLKADLTGLDVRKPLFGETEDHVDLWVGYQRKLNRDITWRIQLNLRNVGESEGLTPISVNPDGVVAAQRITEGMSWLVTNTFSF
ncbi:TonB-dependent receptor plug [Opitutus terrae PB90-1]|uniref:TonB-dependent receptor plug n=2 Tax=Opitutus terrae TaxID=107709 RepID=B1ZVV3_OPITP|nr:TonB-dependent receptor plug [Opitutus terrae PB90-1]